VLFEIEKGAMNKFGITEKSFDQLLIAIACFPEIESAIIFGSRAKGNYKQGSDIDVAICGEKCTPLTAINLSSKLNEQSTIPYKVDVVDYNSIFETDLKDHIDRVGITFYNLK